MLDEYRLKPLPTPPASVKEYMEYDYKHIRQMNEEGGKYNEFWRNPEVKKFYDENDMIVLTNHRNLKILRWLKHQYRNDPEKSGLIQEKIWPFLEAKYCKFKDGQLRMIGYEDINWHLFNIKLELENFRPSPAEAVIAEVIDAANEVMESQEDKAIYECLCYGNETHTQCPFHGIKKLTGEDWGEESQIPTVEERASVWDE
jgi:hypothetical protein